MREPLRDGERLKHIMEAIHYIETASNGVFQEDISSNAILRHALTWNIMVIGEATNKLSKEFCEAHPDTPWRNIAGMRHVLVHDYYHIDVNELWSVIQDDIPVLKSQIEKYLVESCPLTSSETKE